MVTKQCVECGSFHTNHDKDGNFEDKCFNCKFAVDSLNICVEALNRHIPISGKPRKITITGYKIEKVK